MFFELSRTIQELLSRLNCTFQQVYWPVVAVYPRKDENRSRGRSSTNNQAKICPQRRSENDAKNRSQPKNFRNLNIIHYTYLSVNIRMIKKRKGQFLKKYLKTYLTGVDHVYHTKI